MEAKTYNRANFHKHTFCVFCEVPFSEIENREANFQSKSGSSYYFTPEGVYRLSNHWSRVANCRWRLESKLDNLSRKKLGFALWTAFHRDNEHEKLYFITANYNNKTAAYEHIGNAPNNNVMLRTASETAKIVKQIRNLFESDSWAKYIAGDIEMLRQTIIEKLIATPLSLAEIKRTL